MAVTLVACFPPTSGLGRYFHRQIMLPWYYLMNKPDPADRPRRFIVVNRSQGRLDHMRQMVAGIGTDIAVEYVCNADPAVNDHIMSFLPDHSIVINATGMGKDSPGSPITDAGLFPRATRQRCDYCDVGYACGVSTWARVRKCEHELLEPVISLQSPGPAEGQDG